MTLVAGVAIVAGILDAEKLEALIVLFPSIRHRCKLIATTAIKGRCGTAFLPTAPPIAAATALAATICGTARTPARGALAASFDGRCRGATGAAAAAFAPSAPASAATARLTIVCFCGARGIAVPGPGCIRSGGVAWSGGLPNPIAGRQRLIFEFSSGITRGTAGWPFGGPSGLLTAVAIGLWADTADLSFAVTATAATATSTTSPPAAGRSGLSFAATFAYCVLSLATVVRAI